MKIDDPRFTAFALGELEDLTAAERAELDALLRDDAAARGECEETRAFAARLREELRGEDAQPLTASQRAAVLGAKPASDPRTEQNVVPFFRRASVLAALAACVVVGISIALLFPAMQAEKAAVRRSLANAPAPLAPPDFNAAQFEVATPTPSATPAPLQALLATNQSGARGSDGTVSGVTGEGVSQTFTATASPPAALPALQSSPVASLDSLVGKAKSEAAPRTYNMLKPAGPAGGAAGSATEAQPAAGAPAGSIGTASGNRSTFQVATQVPPASEPSTTSGRGSPKPTEMSAELRGQIDAFTRGWAKGGQSRQLPGKDSRLATQYNEGADALSSPAPILTPMTAPAAALPPSEFDTGTGRAKKLSGSNTYAGGVKIVAGTAVEAKLKLLEESENVVSGPAPAPRMPVEFPARKQSEPGNTEAFDAITDNAFLAARENPLSTFSIDVDTASYAIVRRFLNENQRPPKGAVRIEEMINYFTYDYPQPKGDAPFSAAMEVAACPWSPEHRLVRIGLKGREIARDKRPPSNLVFLIDVSGSMQPANKLPLLKQSLRLLIDQLGDGDQVVMVVYAGNSGCVLEPTHDKAKMRAALKKLEAGGSTNGASGIEQAYRLAEKSFITGGTNRVILATDGDWNVGVTNQSDLLEMIAAKAKSGVFLTVLGFGMDNLKDSMLVKLADKGNGNYAYIDTLLEARKVFVEQLSATLVTIAKDVKIQVEFNPAQVGAYRLIGYEKRLLAKEDFNDDTKDAGEIGAGHTVTALYEIVPAGRKAPAAVPRVDPLKYQQRREGSEQSAVSSAQSAGAPVPDGTEWGDRYVDAYLAIQAGEKAEQIDDSKTALKKFQTAAEKLERIAKEAPTWQPAMMEYRRKRTAESIVRVQEKLAASEQRIENAEPKTGEVSAGDAATGKSKIQNPTSELLTLKLRYKAPDGDTSKLLEFPLTDRGETWEKSSRDFRFAVAVAGYGMLLRDSPHKGTATWNSVRELAAEGKGEDASGYRGEFISLLEKAKALAR